MSAATTIDLWKEKKSISWQNAMEIQHFRECIIFEAVSVVLQLEVLFLNIIQDCLQPFGHEMLPWVILRGINAHSVSPQAR